MIECKRMARENVPDAFRLLSAFLSEDEYYLASSEAYGDGGSGAIERALELFLSRPEIGFVWMAYEGSEAVGMCVVCYAISTSVGALVAKMDDVSVVAHKRGRGVGSALLASLKEELRRIGVRRIDVGIHVQNTEALRFYERHGFRPLKEERFACLLDEGVVRW